MPTPFREFCLELTRRIGALKRLRDLAGAGSFPSERLQGPHIRCSPRTTFSVFRGVSTFLHSNNSE